MSRLNENAIEQLAIELLEQQGWKHLYGPDIAPNSDNPQRSSYQEVLLPESLRSAIHRLNPSLPGTAHDDAFKQVERVHAPELIASNQDFHRLLTEGVKVTVRQDGNDRGEIVWLVDFDRPENNEFLAVNQFTITENNQSKRPDLILFVNGLPLVVIELKNPADENATLFSAFQQLQTYKQAISSFFACNELLVVSDSLEARAGSLSAEFSRFMAWKSEDGKTAAERLISQLETLIAGMLNKRTLLDLVRSFIVFEQIKAEDPKTGLITIKTVKKLAAVPCGQQGGGKHDQRCFCQGQQKGRRGLAHPRQRQVPEHGFFHRQNRSRPQQSDRCRHHGQKRP